MALNLERGTSNDALRPEAVAWERYAGEPQPGDEIGLYRHEDLLRMNEHFSNRPEKCFRDGTESPMSACRSYKPSSG